MHHHIIQLTVCFILSSLVLPSLIYAESMDQKSMDQQEVSIWMSEYLKTCDTKAWQLWSQSLCAPLLIVDPNSRAIIASQADSYELLKKQGDLYVGYLPPMETIANTAKQWAGVQWSMLMYPLPEDKATRTSLLAHESWHRIQNNLGLASKGADNSHLSEMHGRFLLILELRALAKALNSENSEMTSAIVDALQLRFERQRVYPKSKDSEQKLELNEGLAEYTGVKLAGFADPNSKIIEIINNFEEKESMQRSFAYVTGPAYGFLLDRFEPSWRENLQSHFSFSQSLSETLDFQPKILSESALTKLSQKYDGESLQAIEHKRNLKITQLKSDYELQFIQKPTLELPLNNMQMSFDPSTVFSLKPHGTVYPTITIIDDWGKIIVKSGALISSDYRSVKVNLFNSIERGCCEGEDGSFYGEGWTLILTKGWRITKTNGKQTLTNS